MTLFFAILPIAVLIFLMTKRNNWPAHTALPLTALITVLLQIALTRSDPILVSAVVMKGALTALTPVMIIAGAVMLFKTQENTGAMDVIRRSLHGISANPVAQVMIVGWAFAFLIEGASGFGTPAALAAPILVGLRFPPIRVAMLCLVMNSVPVSFGAVGTPTWFGFSEIANLSSSEIMTIGVKSAAIHTLAALIIPVYALTFLFTGKQIRANAGYIVLSICACTIPFLAASFVSYEFPSLIGGAVGLILSIVLARRGIGLQRHASNEEQQADTPEWRVIVRNTFPLWGTLLLLVVTRIPVLGIKSLLNSNAHHWWTTPLAGGEWSVSTALVFSWSQIFGQPVDWQFKFLYVPGLIPFVVISLMSFVVLRSSLDICMRTCRQTLRQMVKPTIALIASLIFVNLLMMGGPDSYAFTIGDALARVFGRYWSFAASYLGALGSFISGSNTISNLTFGAIQDAIAQQLNLNRTTILAMQSVGGAMGNMVCINNIVAVCSVLALERAEGDILKRTVGPMIVYGLVAGVVAMLFMQ